MYGRFPYRGPATCPFTEPAAWREQANHAPITMLE